MKRKFILCALFIISVLITKEVTAKRGIEDDLENKVPKEILTNVLNLEQGKVGEIINKFPINSDTWTWRIQQGTLADNINAVTRLANGTAVTTLDYKKLKYASNLSIARTIIHELVHAYLLLYFNYETVKATEEYPGIVKAWYAASEPDYNAIQHEEMAVSLVDDIALALKEYSENLNLSFDNSIYFDLAWGGLDYQNNSEFTEADKKRIKLRLVSAQLNASEKELSKSMRTL